MKKVHFTLISLTIIIIVLFSSCATTNTGKGTSIYGSWKLSRVVTFNPAGQDANSGGYAPTTADDASLSGGSKSGSESDKIKVMVKESVRDKDYSSILSNFPSLIFAIQLKHNNTGTITTQKETITGTWSLDVAGKKIIFTEVATNRVIQVDIAKEGDKYMELFNTVPEGTFIIEYRK